MRNSKQRKRNQVKKVETDNTQAVSRPRTTVFLPDALEFNLDLAALRTRRPKAEIIREALAKYLREELKMEPDKEPEITLSYAS